MSDDEREDWTPVERAMPAVARVVAAAIARHEARMHGRTEVGIREAAQALGVHENTIRNWIDRGALAARVLPSGFRRVPRSEIARLQTEAPTDQEREDA